MNYDPIEIATRLLAEQNRRYEGVIRILAALTFVALVAVDILLLASPPAHAVTPTCEVRTAAHYEQYGGLWADSADHVLRGELPTCNPDEPVAQAKSEDNDNHHDDDRKSRHCRKSWYC